ncbi:MAG: choice-of-anchor Q domain-containing protein [Candidatus Binatia bacterium]
MGGQITSLGHNLSSDTSCGLTRPGDLVGVDPLLGPLQDNGGPTLTHALLPGSPAIDAGDDLACPASDQRRAVRPQDGNGDSLAVCDIGAFEVGVPGDLDLDGDVDRADVQQVLVARNTDATGVDDPRDLDGDGRITVLDARKLVLQCTHLRCAP